MKLACFCMFRNEASILGPFMDQLSAFFDHVILLDHGSTDAGPEMVQRRNDSRFELLYLKAPGYPQQQLATGFARVLLDRFAPDFIFFIDCDEFLPFPDRAALEAFLAPFRGADAVSIPWLNIFPAPLDGGNIFRGRFVHRGTPSEFRKVILTGEMAKHRGWTVSQGYHTVVPYDGDTLCVVSEDASPLYHIPVQSRLQFRFKIAHGSRMLRKTSLLGANLGWHWARLDDKASARLLDEAALRDIALSYGDDQLASGIAGIAADFDFPYVNAPFLEDAVSLSGQLEGLLLHYDRPAAPADAKSFTVTDAEGNIVLASGPATSPAAGPARTPRPLEEQLFEGSFAEDYAALVEPLFKLPTKLPVTAWAGHIPFLFALFRALRPGRYVELGVHNGASLIAAATAASTYGVPTLLTGVDTWQGDDHAGRYEGEGIYRTLLDYTQRHFPGVTLQRSFFEDARHLFMPGSIDILHIDGLHTYDAVKHDFTSWFEKVSPQGVILFHDISVLDRGFGVYRLWAELKQHFSTIEFHHSHGLGVVFLDAEDTRIAPFLSVARSPEALASYQSLVADIADLLPERMLATAPPAQQQPAHARGPAPDIKGWPEAIDIGELQDLLQQKQDHIDGLMRSTSWRITRPLRLLSRALRR